MTPEKFEIIKQRWIMFGTTVLILDVFIGGGFFTMAALFSLRELMECINDV